MKNHGITKEDLEGYINRHHASVLDPDELIAFLNKIGCAMSVAEVSKDERYDWIEGVVFPGCFRLQISDSCAGGLAYSLLRWPYWRHACHVIRPSTIWKSAWTILLR